MEPSTTPKYIDIVPELLANVQREMVPHGQSFVDDREVISVKLTNQVFKKAIIHEVTTVQEDGSADSPFMMASILQHNIESRRVKDTFHRFLEARICMTFNSKSGFVTFPEGGWERDAEDALSLHELVDATSPFGLDYTFGTHFAQPSHFMTAKSTSFEMIDDHFELAPGQRIAIAVSRCSPVNIELTGIDTSTVEATKQFDPKRYCGTELTSNIQTGTIIDVTGDGSFFAHDINTYKGCSGAIVFLLDKNQPESVREQDYGKAIAVHGAAAASDTNIAFSIYKQQL